MLVKKKFCTIQVPMTVSIIIFKTVFHNMIMILQISIFVFFLLLLMTRDDYVITLWNGSLAVIDVSKKKFKVTLIDNLFGWKISYFLLTETPNQLTYETSPQTLMINLCKFFINLPFVYVKVVMLWLEKYICHEFFSVASNDWILTIHKNLGTIKFTFKSPNHDDSWIFSSGLKPMKEEQGKVLKRRQLYVFIAQTILFGLFTRNVRTSAIFTSLLVWDLIYI